MPNPIKIELLNYHFESNVCEKLLTVMLNKIDKDYSTVEEFYDIEELSHFTADEVRRGVRELHNRGFLLKVEKPYGMVYAVNKLRISNMEFVYC